MMISIQRRKKWHLAMYLPLYQLEGREETDPEKRIPHQKRGSGLGTGRTVKTGCQTGYDL